MTVAAPLVLMAAPSGERATPIISARRRSSTSPSCWRSCTTRRWRGTQRARRLPRRHRQGHGATAGSRKDRGPRFGLDSAVHAISTATQERGPPGCRSGRPHFVPSLTTGSRFPTWRPGSPASAKRAASSVRHVDLAALGHRAQAPRRRPAGVEAGQSDPDNRSSTSSAASRPTSSGSTSWRRASATFSCGCRLSELRSPTGLFDALDEPRPGR